MNCSGWPRWSCASLILTLGALVVAAEEPGKVTVVADGLDNPTGVCVHPDGDVFIAARSGVHRLHEGKLTTFANGFNTDIYGKGPKYNIGPLGVACLGSDRLVVGDGSNLDEAEVVYVFKVTDPGAKPLTPAQALNVLGPIPAGADSAKGEGNYYGVAVHSTGIFVTCNGDDTKGWVARSALVDRKPGELKPYIATKVATNVDAPVGITVSPDGEQLVVGQMGEINIPADSLLTMYDPATGKLLKMYKTGLHDIAGLAYSPKTGKLYAVDFAWLDTSQGGLFRLDVSGDEVKATRIATLDRPTAIAFGKNGDCYVTYGAADTDSKPNGKVGKISGL